MIRAATLRCAQYSLGFRVTESASTPRLARLLRRTNATKGVGFGGSTMATTKTARVAPLGVGDPPNFLRRCCS
jgi:hypothetical protein